MATPRGGGEEHSPVSTVWGKRGGRGRRVERRLVEPTFGAGVLCFRLGNCSSRAYHLTGIFISMTPGAPPRPRVTSHAALPFFFLASHQQIHFWLLTAICCRGCQVSTVPPILPLVILRCSPGLHRGQAQESPSSLSHYHCPALWSLAPWLSLLNNARGQAQLIGLEPQVDLAAWAPGNLSPGFCLHLPK